MGSSGRRRGSLVHIPAVLLTKEPWPSEHPSSYDAASQLQDEDTSYLSIQKVFSVYRLFICTAADMILYQEISKAYNKISD